MSERKRRPSRWAYAVAALIPLLGCLVSMALVYSWFPGLPGTFESRINCAPPRPAPSDPRHCTVFTVSRGERVFFAGNDDWHERDSTYWVDPGSDRRYGAIYFGERDNVQQGFNEKGLAYDSNGLPEAPVTSHAGREPFYGGYTSYPIEILRKCATVEEVIAWVQEHRWHEVMHDQLHFADATGDAVVISAGPDGAVAFTRKPAGDGFLVSTNFNVADRSNGSYPCWRYARAERMLSELVEPSERGLTVEDAAAVAEAVHVQSPSGWTIYSVVADLPQRLVYVTYMFQYDAPIVLNVDEEIEQRQPSRRLSTLFPEETQRRADQAYEHLIARQARCDRIGFTWAGLVTLSFMALLVGSRSGRGALALWAPVVAVLGPMGLLSRLLVPRAGKRGHRSRALVETAADLPAYVVGMVAALLTIVLVPAVAQSQPLELLAFYGIPLVIALFLPTARLAWATRSGYPRTVLRRLPVVLVSTNLALAGLLVVGLPLAQWELNTCGISSGIVLAWWIIAVVGALAGGVFLYVYHAWAVRRGFAAWSTVLKSTGEAGEGPTAVTSPPWRRLWAWILFSLVVLIASLAAGIWGTMLAAGAG